MKKELSQEVRPEKERETDVRVSDTEMTRKLRKVMESSKESTGEKAQKTRRHSQGVPAFREELGKEIETEHLNQASLSE